MKPWKLSVAGSSTVDILFTLTKSLPDMTMKLAGALAALSGMLLLGCATAEPPAPTEKAAIAIIPQPRSVEQGEGYFRWNPKTTFTTDAAWPELARQAAEQLRKQTGLPLPAAADGAIALIKDEAVDHAEGYQVEVTPERIAIRASTPAGAFYGLQTLVQLLPPQSAAGPTWFVPCVKIDDAPRFPYRGMHLDVARHFFPVAVVKQYIDMLAAHKQNRFHWHLTDDQGWRIEIKKYPRLAEVAAYRRETLIGHYSDEPQRFDGKRYGGYYTHDEVREVVRYAAERYITVIPEIEMPGHAQAAISAYPELACTPGPFEPATKWGVFEDVFCPKEETFAFLEDVLREVMALFPSEYIHIGGDECPKTRWEQSDFCQQLMQREGLRDEHELQSYFIRRIERFLNANGRKLIGWDEILEGGLAPNATVMSWRGTEGGIAAAQSGHDVIMTPTSFCYFDYYQDDHPDEPLAIGGLLPLEKVYSYEPIPEALTAEQARHILGAQGNVWTEYIPTPEKLQYMVWPRACAMAEIGWTQPERRNYADFATRLSYHLPRLRAWGIQAANHLDNVKTEVLAGDGQGVRVRLFTDAPGNDIHYTLDGSAPTPASARYEQPIPLKEGNVTLKAFTVRDGAPVGRGASLQFRGHKAAGKAIRLTHPPAKQYAGAGPGSALNGVMGSDERYGDAEWLGFEGLDFEAVVDLGEAQSLQGVSLRFYRSEGQWIYAPRSVEVSLSDDGQRFVAAGSATVNAAGEGNVVPIAVPLAGKQGRYLKVKVNRYGVIPAGAQGAGHEAWLFVDEVVVE